MLRCYEEWRPPLDLPAPEIQRILTDESDRGQQLWQNSPFPGAIDYDEVLRVKQRIWAEARAME